MSAFRCIMRPRIDATEHVPFPLVRVNRRASGTELPHADSTPLANQYESTPSLATQAALDAAE